MLRRRRCSFHGTMAVGCRLSLAFSFEGGWAAQLLPRCHLPPANPILSDTHWTPTPAHRYSAALHRTLSIAQIPSSSF
jgi:hypothetical protein